MGFISPIYISSNMSLQTRIFVILLILLTACDKGDQREFDYRTQVDSIQELRPFFDLSRDSIMRFEVSDALNGRIIGLEGWVYMKDTAVVNQTFAKYMITRLYSGDSSVRQILIKTAPSAIIISENSYPFPIADIPFSTGYSGKDTVIEKYSPNWQNARRYRIHAPSQFEFIGDAFYETIRAGIDSLPPGGTMEPYQTRYQDLYFAKHLGLIRIEDRLKELDISERDLTYLIKTRIN